MAGWVACWENDRLVGWMAGCMAGWMAGWEANGLARALANKSGGTFATSPPGGPAVRSDAVQCEGSHCEGCHCEAVAGEEAWLRWQGVAVDEPMRCGAWLRAEAQSAIVHASKAGADGDKHEAVVDDADGCCGAPLLKQREV